jgi:hypothetical protein
MSSLNIYALLARQVWAHRKSKGEIWLFWSLLAMPLLAVPLLLRYGSFFGAPDLGWRIAVGAGIGGPYLLLLMACWVFFLQNLILQNNPLNSHLVPALHARLLRLGMVACLLSTLPAALLLALGYGHFLQYWLFISLLLLAYTHLFSSSWALAGYAVLWFFRQQVQAATAMLWDAPPDSAILWLAMVATVLLAAVSMRLLLKNGGERHWRQYKRIVRWEAAQNQSTATTRRWTQLPVSVQRWPGALYFWLLRRALCSPKGSVRQLAAGLGPGWHWSSVGLPVTVLALPLLLLGHGLRLGGTQGDLLALIAIILATLIGMVPIIFIMQQVTVPYQTRREQQLMRLLPGMPDGEALNQVLARQSLAGFARVWLLCAVLALLSGPMLAHLFDASLLWQVLALACLLPAYLLRDYARQRAPLPTFVMWLLIQSALGLGLALLAQRHLNMPLWLLYVVCGGVGAGLLAWRWRRISAAPSAFAVVDTVH